MQGWLLWILVGLQTLSFVAMAIYYVMLVRRFFIFGTLGKEWNEGSLIISRLFALVLGAALSIFLNAMVPSDALTLGMDVTRLPTWLFLLFGGVMASVGFGVAWLLFAFTDTSPEPDHRVRTWMLIVVVLIGSILGRAFVTLTFCDPNICTFRDNAFGLSMALGVMGYLMDHFARPKTRT